LVGGWTKNIFILEHLSEAMGHSVGNEKMPRTKRKAIARKNVRIPESIMDEVDRIVRGNGLYVNRQQFIESAIRERIEESRLSEKIDADFVARVKDMFLMHAIVNTVKEKTAPANHLNLKEFEEYVRRYIEEKAERKGKRITREQLDELTNYLSEYHKEILEGLGP
jgi:metal-responsive CopG/Arc/MetJ family transcriptional regulator